MKKEIKTRKIKVRDSIEILKEFFPQCFDKFGNFNLEKFQKEIKRNEINISKESYGLEWLGKSYARVRTFDPARTLLKENEKWNKKDENKNSQNVLIKGDNLEVLKHLSNAYHKKIKMIYIDPPYNTGKDDFVYSDDRKFTIEEFMELAGVSEERAKRVLEFVNSKSNSHSAWLTFMYPRLYLARKLLKDDGVIFVSIDDNEVAQLRLLMDEVFGEGNFVAQISVINNLSGRSDDNFFATCNEFLLVYGKDINKLKIKGIELTEEEIEDEYKFEDEFGKYKLTGFRETGKNWEREKRPYLYYPLLEKEGKFYSITKEEYSQIYDKTNKKFNDEFVNELIKKYGKLGFNVYLPLDKQGNKGNWRWGFERYNKEKEKSIILNGSGTPCVKERAFLEDGSIRSKLTKTTWYKGEYDTGSAGKYLKKLFNETIFESPKSIFLIKDILKISTQNNDIVLDFFAGSGTTGDAVMQLNAEDGGNRKFILVQLPEKIDPKKNKTAYEFVKKELGVEIPTIFDITKERLVRAGKKIKENGQLKFHDVDTSFKIFETTPIWDDYLLDEKELNKGTKVFNRILSEEELKSLFITWKTADGSPLTENYQEVKINDYLAYYVGKTLYLMFKNFTKNEIETLIKKIDDDKNFVVDKIILFGYNFESKTLREIYENIENYANKKNIEIEVVIRF